MSRAALEPRPLVHGGDRAQRRAAERAQPVLVHRRRRPLPVGRQLAAPRDPHRVEARVRAAGPARPRPPGTRAARAGRAFRCPPPSGPAPGGSSRPPCAGGRCRHAVESFDHAWRNGPRRVRDAQVGHHEHGVHLLRRAELVREPDRAHLAERGAVGRGEHERLARGAALEDARELEQRRRVGGAAGGVRRDRRVALGHDHDLAPRPAGAAADHVHEVAARVREAVDLHAEAAAARRVATSAAVARSRGCRPRGPGAAPRSRRPWRPPRGRRRARPRPAPAAARAGGPGARTSPAPPPTGPARTPPGKRSARSRCRSHHPAQPTISKVTGSTPRILLVDDEEAVQKLLTYPLRKEGYQVVPALDGQRGARAPPRGQLRPRGAGRDAAAARRLRRLPADPARGARCRSSCSRPRPRRSTRCSAWSSAPTTT